MIRLILALLLLSAPVLAAAPGVPQIQGNANGTPLPINAPDVTSTTTVNALYPSAGSTATLDIAGCQGAAAIINSASSTLVTTLIPSCSGDRGLTWSDTAFFPDYTGAAIASQTTVSGTAYQLGIALIDACRTVRVRTSSSVAGSATVQLVCTQNSMLGNSVSATGVASAGSAVSGNPVLVAGSDGTNVRTLSTDTTGRVNTANLSSDTVGTPVTLNAACATGLTCAAGSTAQVALAGQQSLNVCFSSGASPLMTVVSECSKDGGTTWLLSGTPATVSTISFETDIGVFSNNVVNPGNTCYALLPAPKGATTCRVRAGAYTSGTVSATMRAVSVIAEGDNGYVGTIGTAGGYPPVALALGTQDAAAATTTRALQSFTHNTTTAAQGLATLPGIARSAVSGGTAGRSTSLATDVTTGFQLFNLSDGAAYLKASVLANDTTAALNHLSVGPAISRALPTATTAARGEMLQVETATGGLFTIPIPTTLAGPALATPVSVAVNTTTNVKASAGNVYGAYCANANASVCWLQFYNTAGSPTCGTSVIWSLPIPTSGVLSQPVGGLALANHATGIGVCMGTTPTGSTACTSANACTIFIK